jgi:hypothetical protein
VTDIKSETDPSGRRTVVTLHDDRGKPYKYVSNSVSVLASAVNSNPGPYQNIATIELGEDLTQTPPRPNLLRGQLIVGASIAFGTGVLLFDYVLAEVLVIGYVGGSGTVIGHAMLGALQTIMRASFEDSDTFDRISVVGRQLVGSGTLAQPNNVDLSVIALMWG